MFSAMFRGTGLVLTTAPLIGLPMLAYFFLAMIGRHDAILTSFKMPSGDILGVSLAGGLILFGVVMLILETIKATSTGARAMIDHTLSVMLLMAGFGLMLLVPGFGTQTFAILVLFQLADVVLGALVGIKTARRDFGFNG